MTQLRKFQFDTSFDDLPAKGAAAVVAPDLDIEAEEEEEAPPPPPTFSEEELAAARDEAFESGRSAGRREAEADGERLLATALTAIAGHFGAIERRQRELGESAARNAVLVAVAVIERVLPEYCRRHGTQEIEALVATCLGHLVAEPRLLVRVTESLAEECRGRLEAVAEQAGYDGRTSVVADNRLTPGDCRIEWTDGGAERDQAELWRGIEATVERFLGANPDPAVPAEVEHDAVDV